MYEYLKNKYNVIQTDYEPELSERIEYDEIQVQQGDTLEKERELEKEIEH